MGRWGGRYPGELRLGPEHAQEQVHLPWIAKHADDQLGRIDRRSRSKGVLDETLIVLTADHGATYGKQFYGANRHDGGEPELVCRYLVPGVRPDARTRARPT